MLILDPWLMCPVDRRSIGKRYGGKDKETIMTVVLVKLYDDGL